MCVSLCVQRTGTYVNYVTWTKKNWNHWNHDTCWVQFGFSLETFPCYCQARDTINHIRNSMHRQGVLHAHTSMVVRGRLEISQLHTPPWLSMVVSLCYSSELSLCSTRHWSDLSQLTRPTIYTTIRFEAECVRGAFDFIRRALLALLLRCCFNMSITGQLFV